MRASRSRGTAGSSRHQPKKAEKDGGSVASSAGISKYFLRGPKSPYGSCALTEIKTIDNDDDDDFKSPVKLARIFTNPQTATPKPKRKYTKRTKTKENLVQKTLRDNFSSSDCNPEHLQLALALSKSAKSTSQSDSDGDVTPVYPSTQEIRANARTTLEKFGFKSKNPLYDPPKTNEINKRKKRSRFQYVTPVLLLRTEQERQELTASKISQILSGLSGSASTHPVDDFADVQSEFLRGLRCETSRIFKTGTDDSRNDFHVRSLGFERDQRWICGKLLKKWEEIPGRELSPVRKISQKELSKSPVKQTGYKEPSKTPVKVTEVIELSSDSSSDDCNFRNLLKLQTKCRSVSPDLFESEDDICHKDNNCHNDSNCQDDIVENCQIVASENSKSDNVTICQERMNDCQIDTEYDNKVLKKDDSICQDNTIYQSDGICQNDNICENDSMCQNDSACQNEVLNMCQIEDCVEASFLISPIISKFKSKRGRNRKRSRCKKTSDVQKSCEKETILCENNGVRHFESFCDDEIRLSQKCLENYEADRQTDTETIETVHNQMEENIDIDEQTDLETDRRIDIDTEQTDDTTSTSTLTVSNDVLNDSVNTETNVKVTDDTLNDSIEIISIKDSEDSTDILERETNPPSLKINEEDLDLSSLIRSLEGKNGLNKTVRMTYDTVKLTDDTVKLTDDSVKLTDDNVKLTDDTLKLPKNDINMSNLNITEYVNNILREEEQIVDMSQDSDSSDDTVLNLSQEIENFKSNYKQRLSQDSQKLSDDETSKGKAKFAKHDSVNSIESNVSQDSICISDEELNYSSVYATPSRKRQSKCQTDIDTIQIDNCQSDNDCQTGENDGYPVDVYDDHVDRYDELEGCQRDKMVSCQFDKLVHPRIRDLSTPKSNRLSIFEDSLGNLLEKTNVVNGLEGACDSLTATKCQTATPKKTLSDDEMIVKVTNVTPMPEYERMNSPEIVAELSKFGLKRLKRKKGVQLLKYLYESTHPLLDNEDDRTVKRRKIIVEEEKQNDQENIHQDVNAGETVNEMIFERKTSKKISSCRLPLHIAFHNLVTSHRAVRESILLYEPLQVELIYDMLKQHGHKYHIQDLISFLDRKCITFRLSQGKETTVV